MDATVAGAGYDAGTGAQAELYACHAHAPCRPRHQEPLAHSQASLGEQSVVGGIEHLGEAARFGHRHGGRDGQGETLVQKGELSLGRPAK